MSYKKDASSIVLPNIPLFHLNWDAGDLFINALQSCLDYLGQESTTWWLAGVSGDAFKFVYDKDDVREPMRDRVPIDIVSLACSAMGWEGMWYVNKKMDDVIACIKKSLNQGYPILTINLGSQWYHGANIITGINEDSNELLLQIAREDLSKPYAYEKVPIPHEWDGPVPGSTIWASNPIFIFKRKLEIPDEKQIILKSLQQAIEIHNTKSLPYKDHPGAQKYSTPSLTGKHANSGQSALNELKEEIMHSEITWPKIWSITTQCGQLSYDRFIAARFLIEISKKHSQFFKLKESGVLFKETANIADDLKNSYWDNRSSTLKDSEKLTKEIFSSNSFVYSTSGLETEEINRLRRSLPIMDTLWGPAIIVDNPDRRLYNQALIDKIINNENKCFQLLKNYTS